MADYTDRGVLFAEREKRSEKAPDYRGKLNVAGTEYELAGWKNKDKNGNTYLSLKISTPDPKYQRQGAGRDADEGEGWD